MQYRHNQSIPLFMKHNNKLHEELRHPRKNWSRTIFWAWQAKKLHHPPRMFREKSLTFVIIDIEYKRPNRKLKNIYIFNQNKNGCNIPKINYKHIFMKKQYQIITEDLKHPRKDFTSSTISQAPQKQKILVSHGKCLRNKPKICHHWNYIYNIKPTN